MSFASAQVDASVRRFRPDRPMSDEEFMRFCAANEPVRCERDANGEIIMMSPTGTEGGGVDTDITLELGFWARQDGRGRVYNSSTGFTLPDGSIRSADSHWISWNRLNTVAPADRKRCAPICPEFIVELRSETDRLPDVQEKMRMWIANGVELGWLVDPQHKVVEIYRPGEEPEIHEQPTSVQGDGPVAGFELVMARVWG